MTDFQKKSQLLFLQKKKQQHDWHFSSAILPEYRLSNPSPPQRKPNATPMPLFILNAICQYCIIKMKNGNNLR